MATCDPSTAAGIAKFGLALFALLAEDPSTAVVLVSPLSISAALSLAAAGATPAGAAERELLSALGVGNHTAVAELGGAILSGDESTRGVTLRIANSVWAKQGVLPSYQELVDRTHGARAERLGTTYDELNAWVASKTDCRIPKLMEDPTVDPLVVAGAQPFPILQYLRAPSGGRKSAPNQHPRHHRSPPPLTHQCW